MRVATVPRSRSLSLPLSLAALGASAPAWAQDAPSESPADELPAAAPPAALEPVALGADLVPLVGTSREWRGGDRRGVSVGVVTWSGAVDGFEVTLAGSLVLEDFDGLQATGGAQLVGGPVDGMQLAAGANLAGALDGLQAAGGANVSLGGVDGLQLAGGVNLAHEELDGLQLAGGLNLAGAVDGMQMAPVNVSRGHVDGLQLGLINVARTSDASAGLINLIWEGRTHLDGWVDESSFGNVAIKHGSDRFHNLFGVSQRPFGDCPEWALLYGLGFHSDLTGRLFFEADAIWRHVSPLQGLLIAQNDLYTARALGGLRLVRGVAVTGSLSWNTFVSTVHDGSHYSTVDGPDLAPSDSLVVRQWPGFSVGVQLLPGKRRDRPDA
jgi:hypothetical protein